MLPTVEGRRALGGEHPFFRIPGVTRALPSVPHPIPTPAPTLYAWPRVQQRTRVAHPGAPGCSDSPFSVHRRVDLRGWLTAEGESVRINGFHRRLFLTRDQVSALPPKREGNPSQFA